MSNPTSLLEDVETFRKRLARLEGRMVRELTQAYAAAYKRLQGDIDALLAAINELEAPTIAQIERLTLYRSLQAQIVREVSRYADQLAVTLANNAGAFAGQAINDSARAIQSALNLTTQQIARIGLEIQRLVPEQVITALGFLQRDAALFRNLKSLGLNVANAVADTIRNAVILGWNPRKAAAAIRDATGKGLTWSLNTARTAQLNIYRETSLANYRANNAVVKGWVWWAELGSKRTCLSCIAQHGKFHTLDERLNDHHAGRCTPLPITKSFREMGITGIDEPKQTYETGEQWFRKLPASEQRAHMGDAKYRAWKAKAIGFAEFSQPYADDVYGTLLSEPSLKALLGDKARQFYAT